MENSSGCQFYHFPLIKCENKWRACAGRSVGTMWPAPRTVANVRPSHRRINPPICWFFVFISYIQFVYSCVSGRSNEAANSWTPLNFLDFILIDDQIKTCMILKSRNEPILWNYKPYQYHRHKEEFFLLEYFSKTSPKNILNSKLKFEGHHRWLIESSLKFIWITHSLIWYVFGIC